MQISNESRRNLKDGSPLQLLNERVALFLELMIGHHVRNSNNDHNGDLLLQAHHELHINVVDALVGLHKIQAHVHPVIVATSSFWTHLKLVLPEADTLATQGTTALPSCHHEVFYDFMAAASSSEVSHNPRSGESCSAGPGNRHTLAPKTQDTRQIEPFEAP